MGALELTYPSVVSTSPKGCFSGKARVLAIKEGSAADLSYLPVQAVSGQGRIDPCRRATRLKHPCSFDQASGHSSCSSFEHSLFV